MLTSGHHNRDASECAQELGIPIRASRQAAEHLGGAIAIADGINGYGETLAFFPDELLGDHPDRVKEGLKQAFAGLPERDFEHLLFAHGEPVIGHARRR